jgi:hypothetical protein
MTETWHLETDASVKPTRTKDGHRSWRSFGAAPTRT